MSSVSSSSRSEFIVADADFADMYSQYIQDEAELVQKDLTSLESVYTSITELVQMAEDNASLNADSVGVESSLEAQVEEARQYFITCVEEFKTVYHTKLAVLQQLVSANHNTTTGINDLFNTISARQLRVETGISEVTEALNRVCDADRDVLKDRLLIKSQIEQIKKNRCIFFGCIDVHE